MIGYPKATFRDICKQDKGNELLKNHEVEEDHKDFISDTVSLTLFVFNQVVQKCRKCV